jgi:hypothetical protein
MMSAAPMSRDRIGARLASYAIRCIAAVALVLTIVYSQAALQ